MKVYAIDTGFFKLDGGAMFGVVPKTIWNGLAPADENNLCTLAMRCLLIQDGNKLVLIDTGMGNKQGDYFFKYYYPFGEATLISSLAKCGFKPEDITDVLLTHLHFDHCGGAIVMEGNDYVPTFSNATYWSVKPHWQWAMAPNPRERASFLKENILPIEESGQLKFVPLQQNQLIHETPILQGLQVRLSYGHTEAMLLPQFVYKGTTIVYVADLFPTVAHLPISYLPSYDVRPLTTMDEKNVFLKEALDNDYLLFFEHDPEHECCSLYQTPKGIRAKNICKLSALG